MDPAYRSLDASTIHEYRDNEQKLNLSKYINRHIPTLFFGALTGGLVVYNGQPQTLQRFGIKGGLCLPFGAIYGAALFYFVNFQLRGGWEFELEMEDRRKVNKGLFGKQQL